MTSPLSFLSLEGGLWAGFVSFFFFFFLFLKEGRWEQELLLVRKEGRKERRFPPPTCHANFAGPAKGASPPASAGKQAEPVGASAVLQGHAVAPGSLTPPVQSF